jgi:hypothetical protein
VKWNYRAWRVLGAASACVITCRERYVEGQDGWRMTEIETGEGCGNSGRRTSWRDTLNWWS